MNENGSYFSALNESIQRLEKIKNKVLPLVRPGGFEPLAFRVGELRQGSATRR